MKIIYAEIITIGDEILYGQITDTNSQWISSELDKVGVRVRRKVSVGDVEIEILDALKKAESRSDIIILTGGLGPTNDDITKKTLCRYFNSELVLHDHALVAVTEFFKSRGRELTDSNRSQALLPDKCEYIPNPSGTAPGMLFKKEKHLFFSLPGVPHEMKTIMNESVIPIIKNTFELPVIYHKVIKTSGIGESFLADKIKIWESQLPDHIKLAYLPSFQEVKLRLTATGTELFKLQSEVEEEVVILKALISEYIFGYDGDVIEAVIGQILLSNELSISIAESCTGGSIASQITSIPGCSKYFKGSMVAYSNDIKTELLGVQKESIEHFGAVSEQVVGEMARNVAIKFNTQVGLSTSGIAGPTGGASEKPVGTVWIGCYYNDRIFTKKSIFGHQREVNIRLATVAALNLLRRILLEIE